MGGLFQFIISRRNPPFTWYFACEVVPKKVPKLFHSKKKIKHKKKKVKFAVLKYYKVDENGKIHRLRRECTSQKCGAGVFMAAMEDRHYCGKCRYTLVFSKPEKK